MKLPKLNEDTLKKAGKKAGQFGAIGAGLGLATYGMKKVPGPWFVPGLAAMLLGMGVVAFSDNDYLDALGYGIGGAGVLNLAKKAGTQYPSLAFLSDNVPTLAGFGNDNISVPGYESSLLSGLAGDSQETYSYNLLS